MNKKNATNWPSSYTCKFLEQGLVSYKDMGLGTLLLKKETIDKMAQTFVGKPVIINHDDVTPENIDQYADGYVTKM